MLYNYMSWFVAWFTWIFFDKHCHVTAIITPTDVIISYVVIRDIFLVPKIPVIFTILVFYNNNNNNRQTQREANLWVVCKEWSFLHIHPKRRCLPSIVFLTPRKRTENTSSGKSKSMAKHMCKMSGSVLQILLLWSLKNSHCEVHDSISISEVGKLRLGVRATTALCQWCTPLKTQLPELASGAEVGFQPSLAPQLLATYLAVHSGPAQKSQETYPRSQFRNRGLTDSEVYVPAFLTN